MTVAEDVNDLAVEVGASATALRDRVLASLGAVRGELQATKDSLQAKIDEDAVEETVLTEALGHLSAADAIIDSIEAAPVEEPPEEEEPPVEPPVEEPPVEPVP